MRPQPTQQEQIQAIEAMLLRCEDSGVRQGRRIGVEVEHLALGPSGGPIPFSQGDDSVGIAKVLSRLQESIPGASPIASPEGHLLGLKTTGGKVSLEPGSQVEFSAEASRDLHEVSWALDAFEGHLRKATEGDQVYWLGLGVSPLVRPDSVELIPSPRYAIMNGYLPLRGTLATSMMRLTTSIQINLDFDSEAQALEMLRVGLGMAPVSYALFGNSPLSQGRESGLLSTRGGIWTRTDPDRCGLLPKAFEPGFSLGAYAEHIWKLPLMFTQNPTGKYLPADGQSLAEMPGPVSDQLMQMAIPQLFTEARLKAGYVEVRSVDGLPRRFRDAAIAFWTGLLYDKSARFFALDFLATTTSEDRESALRSAFHTGLKGKYGPQSFLTLASELASAARLGLAARNLGEEKFLDPVFELLDEERNLAQRFLVKFQGEWGRDLGKMLSASYGDWET